MRRERITLLPKEKEVTNVDFMETIRGKIWELKDLKGITYRAMADEAGIGYATFSNFASCHRDTMNKSNWYKMVTYIEPLYDKMFNK